MLKPHPHPGYGRFPRPGVKELPSLYFSNWFFLPSLSMGSFLFEVLFWISFQLAFRLLWFLFFWPHLELRASWQFEFLCRPPLDFIRALPLRYRLPPSAPRGGAARTYCLLSVTALSAAWSHRLLSSVFLFTLISIGVMSRHGNFIFLCRPPPNWL